MNELSVQENRIIETYKELFCFDYTAQKKWKMETENTHRLLAPTAVPVYESPTNSRKAVNIISIFRNFYPSTTRKGAVIAGNGVSQSNSP
jgi:hypothetical protein